MKKVKMIGNTEIRQFTVEISGIYLWRRTNIPPDLLDYSWSFGLLSKGEKIDGQFEGCGPIEFITENH